MRTSFAHRTELKRASLWQDVIMMTFGVLASWAITHWRHLQALSELRAEVDERRRVVELVFRGIGSVGSIKYSRNARGRVVGVAIELRGQA